MLYAWWAQWPGTGENELEALFFVVNSVAVRGLQRVVRVDVNTQSPASCQEYLLRLMRRSLPKWSVHLASHIPPGRESIAHRKTSRRLGSVQWSSSTMCNCSDNFVQLPAGFDYMVHSSRYFILGFRDSVDFIFGFGLSYRYNTYSIPLPTRMLYTGETNLYHS